jgi:hypothetical protein
VVQLAQMRRMLIFAIALGLIGLGPVPLSACALFYSQPAECATPQNHSLCERMEMDQSNGPSVAASSKACCLISEAPLPEAQYSSGNLSLAATPLIEYQAIREIPRTGNTQLGLLLQDLSPPPLQSVLCTFLI